MKHMSEHLRLIETRVVFELVKTVRNNVKMNWLIETRVVFESVWRCYYKRW